jgi:hypothetical protein
MWVFENRMLRRILVLKREKISRGWIKITTDDFHNMYSSPNIISIII